MAWDEGLAEQLREDLTDLAIVERKMFGGLAFLRHGHMVCGVHKRGAMFRAGKPHMTTAMGLPGVGPMTFIGKAMGGMVACDDAACADDAVRRHLMALALALAHVDTLPPKASPK